MDNVILIDCPKCARKQVEAHHSDQHLCVDCVKAENTRLSYQRQHQEDWMAEAKENCIDIWLRQPRETQWEYTVWCAYRDTYPGKPATYTDLAKQLNTSSSVVRNIAMRWTFQARMQAWIAYCDKVTIAQRRSDIMSMNQRHIDMANKMNAKIEQAIDNIDPMLCKPGELATMMRTAAELERKARIDTLSQEDMLREAGQLDDNPDLKKTKTNTNDMSEIVAILEKAGVLNQMKVTKTVTTIVEPTERYIDVDIIEGDR